MSYRRDDDDDDDPQDQRYGTDDDDDQRQEQAQDDDDNDNDVNAESRGAGQAYAQQQDDDDDDDQQVVPQRHAAGAAAAAPADDDDDDNVRPATHPTTYQSTNKPMSDPAQTDPDELYQAAIMVMKHLLVQTHNAAGVAAGTHNHESVMDQPVAAHPNDDWRIQYLQTEDADGNPVSLEAKMDTGADANLISVDACEVHGLEIEELGPDAPTFTVGSGAETGVDGQVFMRYRAGDPPQPYQEGFYAKEGLPHDIILGMPFLLHSHALTLNPSFAKKQSNGDFLLLETTAASKKTQQQRQTYHDQAAARKQATAVARKAGKGH